MMKMKRTGGRRLGSPDPDVRDAADAVRHVLQRHGQPPGRPDVHQRWQPGVRPVLGRKRSAIYDPKTEVFTNIEDMADGRWYPTPIVLGDGRIWTFSGLDVNGSTNSTVEIYTVGSGWSQEYVPGGPHPSTRECTSCRTATSSTRARAATRESSTRPRIRGRGPSPPPSSPVPGLGYGTSVLLPLSPTDNYRARVMIFGGGNPATASTEVIEPLAASPAWASTVSMSQPRIQLNATILPSGRILVTGGSSQDENESTASLNADLFNPDATPISRSSAGVNALPRLYHSNALLLPDATVMLTGGNPERGLTTKG